MNFSRRVIFGGFLSMAFLLLAILSSATYALGWSISCFVVSLIATVNLALKEPSQERSRGFIGFIENRAGYVLGGIALVIAASLTVWSLGFTTSHVVLTGAVAMIVTCVFPKRSFLV